MNQNPTRVEGHDYLYQRGRRYVVRVQVPRELRLAVGRGELKKSLGGDFLRAKREYHATVAEFLGRIDAARRQSAEPGLHTISRNALVPSNADIDTACYDHFRLMVANLRGKAIMEVGDNPYSRENRAQGYRAMIENQIDAYYHEAWNTMSVQADWLCGDLGWQIDPKSETFEYLCRTMLRARLQAYRNELRRLEGKMSDDPDTDPLFTSRRPKPTIATTTLCQLKEKFEEEREDRWSPSTRKNYAIIFRVLEEICGGDTPLATIDRKFCRDVRTQLSSLPANYQKSAATRGRPIAEAIEVAKKLNMPTISPATINSHLTKLGAVIRFGRDGGWIVGNPMADIEVPDPVDPSDKRDPFTVEQLNLIFACDTWERGLDTIADRPSRYWAPLIALYSGARLTEICGQRVDEMVTEDGVHLFHFVHRPGDRHIKTGKSRKVPVHPDLIALGFWDFVKDAQASKRDHLFPDVKRDKLGKWGDHTTKWFSRQVKALGLKGRNLSFHSFRHSFEDALREADLHDTPLGNALTGRWSAGVSKNYGTRYPVKKLYEAMCRVRYPGLNYLLPPTGYGHDGVRWSHRGEVRGGPACHRSDMR
ncbi:tyrosine-type recombinase/integrase [Sphingopyxis fribergensis]